VDVESSPNRHLLSRALDTCRANLRVCDHLLHEYNITLIFSTVHRFNGAAMTNMLFSSSVRDMDIRPETPMGMPPPPVHTKRHSRLTVVNSVTTVQPRLFPMYGPFTFQIPLSTTLSASSPPKSALIIRSISSRTTCINVYSNPSDVRRLMPLPNFIDYSSQIERLGLRQVSCLNQVRMRFSWMVDPSTSSDWRIRRPE
jgi:hypothetical protein